MLVFLCRGSIMFLCNLSICNFSFFSFWFREQDFGSDYTPGIYEEGYIVFVFPFVRFTVCMSVCMFVCSFVLPSRL